MQAGNHPEVSRIAHSIKGGCAMVGLSGATGAAALLEISTTSETWFPQLAKLQSALGALEGILITDFPI
jgi:HPt (histidine-containing phosphotransfer) domain-containing protein